MTTRQLPSNVRTQHKPVMTSFIPIASQPNHFVMPENTRDYYITQETPTQGWSKYPTAPVAFNGYTGGHQYVMMVPENRVMMGHNGVPTQLTYMQGGVTTANHYNNLIMSSQWQLPAHFPDVRLNPNSREFVKKPTNDYQMPKSQTNNPKLHIEARNISIDSTPSLQSSPNSYGRMSSSDSSGLCPKLRNLNIRYHSGDSGIAEYSSSSTTWSSDDDVDGFTTSSDQEKNSSSDEVKERTWTILDDDLYWTHERRSRPSGAVLREIVKQIDFYMSDDYLAKDKYLLRQIRCKKDGYVSIKLMTSFKKMKKLAQDWTVLRSAICRGSKTIIVSAEGLRIRRRRQLSEELRKPRMLTSVLAIRLPEEYNAVDKVTSLFRVFGEIGLVRLLRPQKAVPVDLRNYATQVPDIGLSLCAVVEFESATDALSAVRVLKQRNRDVTISEQDEYTRHESNDVTNELNDVENERLSKIIEDMPHLQEMRLALLGPRVRRTLYRQDRKITPTSSRCHSKESDVTNTLDSVVHRTETSDVIKPAYCEKWRNVRSMTSRSPGKQNNVIRQPRGPFETRGFQFIRNLSI